MGNKPPTELASAFWLLGLAVCIIAGPLYLMVQGGAISLWIIASACFRLAIDMRRGDEAPRP